MLSCFPIQKVIEEEGTKNRQGVREEMKREERSDGQGEVEEQENEGGLN